MRNQLKAEMYKFRHSKMPFIISVVCFALILISFIFGEMVFFGAGDGTTIEIGFQAKCYLSEGTPTFRSIARSSLAYTAFFWIIAGLFTTLFFLKEYSTGTIRLSVAYGTNRHLLYYTKVFTIYLISFLFYITFVTAFFCIEIIQSGYAPGSVEIWNMLGWTLLCGLVLTAFESILIFLCVLISNAGIVIGTGCLYVFAGASVYLMLWGDMENVTLPLKIFVYGSPMYYWMNFSSCRTMGITEHLPFYLAVCFMLTVCGGFIVSKKEIK